MLLVNHHKVFILIGSPKLLYVKQFWGTDEYEYFMMIHQKHVAKFILCCFWKGFTFEERFTVADLRELCDKYEIEYSTDNWF